MKKKHLIIIGIIILGAITILGLYQTFALSGEITTDTSGYYNVTVSDGTTVNVPANSSKTVYYKLTNTTKGVVQYGVGYSGTNITVKYYSDTQDPVTGTVDYGKSKFIKLYIENSGSTTSTVTLSTILGYEKGGDLIVPSGVTLVNESYTEPISAVTLITNLYNNATKTTVTNNDIDYEYDATNSLMKDVGNNIRYYGASPNNYIYFNCTDYSNQSSSTCETWRIIGIVDGKLKIMRNGVIGKMNWNKSSSNDWSTSTLNDFLNTSYLNSIDDSNYTTIQTSEIGINSVTRELISTETYSLKGYNNKSAYANQIYTSEKEIGSVYNGNAESWTGKIAIPYASDYMYSADMNKCTSTIRSYYSCRDYNWMDIIMVTGSGGAAISGWLLTHRYDNGELMYVAPAAQQAYFVNQYQKVSRNEYNVVPTILLNNSIKIDTATNGSEVNPYKISIN